MSRGKPLPKEQLVKLIVGAGQASPSPPVGPALGSKGVKSMDFCKVSCFILDLKAHLHSLCQVLLHELAAVTISRLTD